MKIIYVDGARIRNTVETDFSGTGDSAYYPCIPAGQYWIERYLRPERSLLIKLIALEKRMKNELFSKIRAVAKKELTTKGKVRIVRTERCKGVTVRYVIGADVRATLDPYFLLGGHGIVYEYIPKNEVWIESSVDPDEQAFTLVHEMHERSLMMKGMSYDDAHDFSLAAERAARRKAGLADFIRG